jgi:hypothetical protein
MPKFSRKRNRPGGVSPVQTIGPSLFTHEGGVGYARDAKSELFLLAISSLVREASFYEKATERDERLVALTQAVTKEDPDWLARFIGYLRNTLQMRSASVVLAAEYVRAGGPGGRNVVSSALVRADEPAELLAYWHDRYGRRFPQPVKRGVADGATRLYTPSAALKYDGLSRAWRMADVIELVHPRPRDEEQARLFRYLLDKRHERPAAPTGLTTIDAAAALEAVPISDRRALLATPTRLSDAAMTWERLSGWLQGPMDAEAWEAMIPSMGYMALLRNLRNFDEAGISEDAASAVAGRLRDPEEVARSRQLPIRFYSAWAATKSMRWGEVLEQGLGLSLHQVPSLAGTTLILVDVSGSMNRSWSGRSAIRWWQIAALFGTALAKRAEHADVFAYSNEACQIEIGKGTAVLRGLPAFMDWKGAGGGTRTLDILRDRYNGQDRVVILTDEQAFASTADPGAITAPIYTFNVVGYKAGHLPSGAQGRYTFGGLNDSAFLVLSALDSLGDASWPFYPV